MLIVPSISFTGYCFRKFCYSNGSVSTDSDVMHIEQYCNIIQFSMDVPTKFRWLSTSIIEQGVAIPYVIFTRKTSLIYQPKKLSGATLFLFNVTYTCAKFQVRKS